MGLAPRIALILLSLLPTAGALAQECPASPQPELTRAFEPVSGMGQGWKRAGTIAIDIADGVSMAAGLVVTGAVLIGSSAAWVPVAAAVLAGYGLIRWGGVLISREVHHQSLDPVHNLDARRAWLSLAGSMCGVGTAAAVANGARAVALTTTIAGNAFGSSGAFTGAWQVIRHWRQLSPGDRLMDLVRAVTGTPPAPDATPVP